MPAGGRARRLAGVGGGRRRPARVRRVWAQLAEMGVLGAAVPEADGGLGLDAVALVGLLEEAGRAALPLPLMETAFVAGAAARGARARRSWWSALWPATCSSPPCSTDRASRHTPRSPTR